MVFRSPSTPKLDHIASGRVLKLAATLSDIYDCQISYHSWLPDPSWCHYPQPIRLKEHEFL
ncbi:hypothetical protein DENIT_10152 [Pseudomonas veronii]|nr:hypothetical protein DENIT_10152 [Pseudomonas veronii]